MAQLHSINTNSDAVRTVNPATGETIKTYQPQSLAEVQAVADNAHKAFQSWKNTDIETRADYLRKLGEALRSNKERLAQNMTRHMGKPIKQAIGEVEKCAELCDYTAKHDIKQLQDEKRDMDDGYALVTYQPLGVILSMQPWNFPMYQIVRCTVPNLLAGNTMVVKHAECVWGVAEDLQDLCNEIGLPEHVFNAIYCDDETADELIAHQAIRGVTMTGSAEGGKVVGAKAGEHLKKSVLELGGSDPYIVLKDADIEQAVETCVPARIFNSGQTCVNAKRFIVVENVYDAFKEKFVAAMKDISYGDPTKEDVDMGPLARDDVREKLHKQVSDSIKKGAKCLVGGTLPDGKGAYYPATILENVTSGMPAYDEELFGPVASLIKAKDEEDAIRIANDHEYGLGGGVFTKDTKRGIEIARTKIDTGMVNVNGYHGSKPNLPFGGVKNSGYGREHGGFGVREFVNIKSVMVTAE